MAPHVRSASNLAPSTLDQLAGGYRRQPPPHTPAGPLSGADPDALRIALDLAGGDARRLQVDEDGAVWVCNGQRSSRPVNPLDD